MSQVLVERLTMRPTMACNMRCKYCNEYSPYYDSPYRPTLDEALRDLDRAFTLIDHIGIFEISGGEPLIYKPLPDMLAYINKYNQRFDFFSLVTNGSILLSRDVLERLQAIGPKTRVIVDDYGNELSRQAQRNAELLAGSGVRYELRDQYANIHSDGWLDFSDFALKHDEAEAKKLFSKCVCPQKLHWVITMHKGKLYPCHVQRRCFELNIVPESATECINMHDKNLTDEELRRNIMGLYSLDALSACRYCAGFIESRERIRPGEQL